MTAYDLPDYTLTGVAISVTAIAAALGVPIGNQAKWVQFVAVAVASAAAPIRVGANPGASRGVPLGGVESSTFFPAIAELTSWYSLDNAKVYGAAGDVVAISYTA